MSSRAAVFWVGVFVALALVGGGIDLLRDGGSSQNGPLQLSSTGRVVRVIDGDTVRVHFENRTETVRYIGVDTPETVKPGEPVQCFGKRASGFNRRVVAGRLVRLRFGRERRDRYGRLLAYVFPGHARRSINSRLVAGGYGSVLTIPPNTAHLRPYTRLEQQAKRRGLGVWSACPLS
jgi:micrococcal nuclease